MSNLEFRNQSYRHNFFIATKTFTFLGHLRISLSNYDEIFSMENRYRMLSDDKARSEHENRLRLDRASDEIADARRQLEELKFLLQEKSK